MKARILFDAPPKLRDALLEESKKQHIQFDPFIRKILKDFISNPYKLYPRKLPNK